eukprot:103180_1
MGIQYKLDCPNTQVPINVTKKKRDAEMEKLLNKLAELLAHHRVGRNEAEFSDVEAIRKKIDLLGKDHGGTNGHWNTNADIWDVVVEALHLIIRLVSHTLSYAIKTTVLKAMDKAICADSVIKHCNGCCGLKVTVEKDSNQINLSVRGDDIRKILPNMEKLVQKCSACGVDVWKKTDEQSQIPQIPSQQSQIPSQQTQAPALQMLVKLLSSCSEVIKPFRILNRTEYSTFNWEDWLMTANSFNLLFCECFTAAHMSRYQWALNISSVYGKIAQALNRTYRCLYGVDPLESDHHWRNTMILYRTPRYGGKGGVNATLELPFKYGRYDRYVVRETSGSKNTTAITKNILKRHKKNAARVSEHKQSQSEQKQQSTERQDRMSVEIEMIVPGLERHQISSEYQTETNKFKSVNYDSIHAVGYYVTSDKQYHWLKSQSVSPKFNLLKDSFSLIVKTSEAKIKLQYFLMYVTDIYLNYETSNQCIFQFKTVASPQLWIPGDKGSFRKFKSGDFVPDVISHLMSNAMINVVINKSMLHVQSKVAQHPLLFDKIRDWNTFSKLKFEAECNLVKQIKRNKQSKDYPILRDDDDVLQKNWQQKHDKFNAPGFLRECSECKLMVSPKHHWFCVKDIYKPNSPSSSLPEKLYTAEWKSKSTKDPTSKYTTLTSLNLSEYYVVFWTLHDKLVESLCNSFKSVNASPNGIEISVFVNILLNKVRSIYVGNIGDAPWKNICMICERFSAIITSNTKVVILKLWIKRSQIVNSKTYFTLLRNEVATMIGN